MDGRFLHLLNHFSNGCWGGLQLKRWSNFGKTDFLTLETIILQVAPTVGGVSWDTPRSQWIVGILVSGWSLKRIQAFSCKVKLIKFSWRPPRKTLTWSEGDLMSKGKFISFCCILVSETFILLDSDLARKSNGCSNLWMSNFKVGWFGWPWHDTAFSLENLYRKLSIYIFLISLDVHTYNMAFNLPKFRDFCENRG